MSKKDYITPTDLFFSNVSEDTKEAPADRPEKEPEAFNIPAGYRLVRESKSKRLQLLVTPTTAANLKTAAALEGVSLNEICNRAFEEFLRKEN